MRNEDLIPAFADELRMCLKRATPNGAMSTDYREAFEKLLSEADAIGECTDECGEDDCQSIDYDSEEASELLSELFDALSAYAPAHGYFGANEGDGADYGYWLSQGFEHDFEGVKQPDAPTFGRCYNHKVEASCENGHPVTKRCAEECHATEYLEVNDHGNMTLWARHGLRWRTVWSIV
jgi:hypothetical protein